MQQGGWLPPYEDGHRWAQQAHGGSGRGPEAVAGSQMSTFPPHCLQAQQGPMGGFRGAVPPADQIPGLQPEIGTDPFASHSANPYTGVCNAVSPPSQPLGELRHAQLAVTSQPLQGPTLSHPLTHLQTDRRNTGFGVVAAPAGGLASAQDQSSAEIHLTVTCRSAEPKVAEGSCQGVSRVAVAETRIECYPGLASEGTAGQSPPRDASNQPESGYRSDDRVVEGVQADPAAMLRCPWRGAESGGSPRGQKRGRSEDRVAEQDCPPPAKRPADFRGLRGDPSIRMPVTYQVIAVEVRPIQMAHNQGNG